ncbi:hypothetical protein MML48_6g00006386 [Holotrichia oblita]|nr:hypothetical protein MML48_6g00006386 [Holotrichia oblita]
MRKASLQTQTSEPLIVVDDSKADTYSSSEHNSEDDSPTMNPYLLSPWTRDIRKHSLPTPQCSGITASQVRRLSERGEGAPGPRQTEFLATLSSAPAPVPGGRRHSVVTISRVPTTLFGRNRRESVAAFPSSVFPGRILPSRRESVAGPPSTEPRGSVHNLQLDIMDDIVQARKVRMKLWNTSNERVCEVQPLDEAGGVQRYAASSSGGRRYSDFVGTTLAPIPSSTKRRASELPQPPPIGSSSSPSSEAAACSSTACKPLSSGIICTNTDLISILSSLTSSATEINQQCETSSNKGLLDGRAESIDKKRNRLKNNRSNSFDISILYGACSEHNKIDGGKDARNAPKNWFVKRHQPMSSKSDDNSAANENKKIPQVTFANEKKLTDSIKKKGDASLQKVIWDERSGSLVDAQLLGNAIEDFLRRSSPDKNENLTTATSSPSKGAIPKTTHQTKSSSSNSRKSSWFSSSNNKGDGNSNETCESSNICSTLKDLFVK